MKLSVLKSFLDKEIPYSVLKRRMEEEIAEYKKQLEKKGSRVPVLVDEDIEIQINTEHLETLCEAYIKGEVENKDMYYIVDVLLLAEFPDEGKGVSFSSEELQGKFESLTDPEMNYVELTPDIVRSILKM